MDFFQSAIKKKLEEIDDERQRWTKQHDMHLAAERNLNEFPKSFKIDVMVPIGSKGLMPGKLYHTNEIFIGHYSGLFSKCSAHKAVEVCKHRIKTAQDHLNALDTEWQMYQDRLEIPYTEDVFTNNDGQREILEEYSEGEEQQWREEHKKRMTEHKQREAAKRKEFQSGDDKDYLAILENMELLEELEEELETLGIESDEQLQEQLGNVPSKQMLYEQNDKTSKDRSKFANESANKKMENPDTTEMDEDEDDEDDDYDDDDDDEDTNDSAEFQLFYENIKNYTPVEQLTLYKMKMVEVTDYLAHKKVINYDDLNEKVGQLAFKECLVSAIDKLKDVLPPPLKSSDENQLDVANVTVQPSANLINDVTEVSLHSHFNRKNFARSEKEYAERSKGEQLVFYKSQLRSAIKLIASSSPNVREDEMEERRLLYEYLTNRIDQLRAEILKELLHHQNCDEERFVDDDDSDNEIKSKSDNDDDDVNDDIADRSNNDDSDNGNTSKRRISFADQTTITTYHQDDEPWCIHKANDENMKILMDKTFQFFNSPDNSGDENETNKNCEQLQHAASTTSDPAVHVADSKQQLSTDKNTTIDQSTDTLVIEFNHSSNRSTERTTETNAILNPSDIYRLLAQDGNGCTFAAEQSSQQDLLRKYVMNVANLNVNDITERMRSMYANKIQPDQVVVAGKCDETNSVQNQNPNLPNLKPRKSILKNKEAVSLETHNNSFDFQDENELNCIDKDNARESFSSFDTIVGDIVENSFFNNVIENAEGYAETTDSNSSMDNHGQETKSSDPEQEKASKKPVSLFKRSRKQ